MHLRGAQTPEAVELAPGSIALIHGLGSRVHTPETDLVEGGVATTKPTTPEDKQGDTNTQ